MARRQQGRITRQGAARHSDSLAKSAGGDPRDHRREAQRLTDKDLDPEFLKIEGGRITLVGRARGAGASVPPVVDKTTGTASETVPEITDPETPAGGSPASVVALHNELVTVTLPAIRDALATLSATMNAILRSKA